MTKGTRRITGSAGRHPGQVTAAGMAQSLGSRGSHGVAGRETQRRHPMIEGDVMARSSTVEPSAHNASGAGSNPAGPTNAQKAFWSYQSDFETPDYSDVPAGAFKGSRDEWESLTPGMRREIVRSFGKRAL